MSRSLINELEIVLRHIQSIESPGTVLEKWCHPVVLRSAESGLKLIEEYRRGNGGIDDDVDANRSSGQKRPSGGKGQCG